MRRDWQYYKGLGPWKFEKQPDVWGYLNNKRWSNLPEARAFSSGKGLSLDRGDKHNPCGHWHTISPTVLKIGRLLGWDSLYNQPYAFGYDTDNQRIIKVDMTTLEAVAWSEIIDPGWGRYIVSRYTRGIQGLIIDQCHQLLYLIASNDDPLRPPEAKIWQVDPHSLAVIGMLQLPFGLSFAGATADMQWLYITTSMGMFVASTNFDEPMYVYTPVKGNSMGYGGWGVAVSPYEGVIYMTLSENDFGGLFWFDLEDMVQGGRRYVEHTLYCTNEWGGELAFNPYNKFGICCFSYHPFAPRYIPFRGKFGTKKIDCDATPAYDALCIYSCYGKSNLYVCGSNFYPAFNTDQYYTSWIHNVGRGRLAFYSRDNYHPRKLIYHFFEEAHGPASNQYITCDRVNDDRVVARSVKAFEGEEGGRTYLSRFTKDMVCEVFRKKLEAKPRYPDLGEPQVWQTPESNWVYPEHFTGV